MATDVELIERSLEKIGEKGVDITSAVYARFFANHPDAVRLFHGKEQAVLGKMLNEVLMSSVDCAGHANFLHGLLTTQANDHMAWGVKAEMYGAFFDALVEEIRDVLGPDWDRDTQIAWQKQCTAMEEIMMAAYRDN
ncbi:MAG TPA: globin [Pseudomonadales bacterium]|nr:globin [Pseudomonadales bacterium]